ncbi:MAG: hypothetical protein ACQBVK_02635, partial [Candidatus Phytoplasma sp. TWB_XP]
MNNHVFLKNNKIKFLLSLTVITFIATIIGIGAYNLINNMNQKKTSEEEHCQTVLPQIEVQETITYYPDTNKIKEIKYLDDTTKHFNEEGKHIKTTFVDGKTKEFDPETQKL